MRWHPFGAVPWISAIGIFSLLISIGCVSAERRETVIPKPESYEYHLCEGIHIERIAEGKLRGKEALTKLKGEADEFLKGDGNNVYMVVHWFDLIPNKEYDFRFEWYRPDGKMLGSQGNTVKVLTTDWYTYNYLKLDSKYNHPSGQWTVKVYANQERIVTAGFLLANTLEEIAALRRTRFAPQQQNPTKETRAIRQPPTLSGTGPQDRFAVIIGISNYGNAKGGGLNDLIYADDDAHAFADILLRLGWKQSHINLLVNENATRRNILIALESWLTKAGPNDQIVLFWAGHGFPDPEDPEKVYFACYDTDVKIPATGYRMDRVRTALEERKAKNVMIFVDTCHAGKLITRGERNLSIVPGIQKMRGGGAIPKGWIFMVGADTDRKSIEHTSWKNGAFTHCLVKGLSGEADGYLSVSPRDGIITMRELKSYLSDVMPEETQKVLGVAKRAVITTSSGDPAIWEISLNQD